MSNTNVQNENGRTRGGFALSSLGLLVTVFAAVFASLDLERWSEQYVWLSQKWPWRLVTLFGVAGLLGGLIGVVHCFFLASSGRARWVAPLAGMLAGLIGAVILVAPGPIWRTLFAMSVLLVAAVLVRVGAD
jgi:hypothetical protein